MRPRAPWRCNMAKPVMHTGTDAVPCAGVVLAGGRSSRMGCDKALLIWHGRPLIEHQLALLRAAGTDMVRVSGDRPAYHGIADVLPKAGPLGGLASIAAHIDNDTQLLVIPVDMPLLQVALLRRLLTEQPQASCLRFTNQVLPLRVRLDARCRSVLDELVHIDDPRRRSLRALQLAVGVEEIALWPDEAAQLTDCNTEAIWSEVVG